MFHGNVLVSIQELSGNWHILSLRVCFFMCSPDEQLTFKNAFQCFLKMRKCKTLEHTCDVDSLMKLKVEMCELLPRTSVSMARDLFYFCPFISVVYLM